MSKKIYAVAAGRKKGIFQTWEECQESVNGYSNAKFQGFHSKEAAEQWLEENDPVLRKKKTQVEKKAQKATAEATFSSVATQDQGFDFVVYTDGGCAHNPYGPGGIGVVIQNVKPNEITEVSEGYFSTTNNRMEIMAVIRAFERIPDGARVHLYSDSQYVLNTINGLFRKSKNIDLWEQLDRVMAGKSVRTTWVKGHAGNPLNERCDSLASEAMRSPTKSDKKEKEW